MKIQFLILLIATMAFTACQSYNPPSSKSKTDSVYTSAHANCHGTWYPGLGSQVVSLDLLTAGLKFDSAYYISGTGYNLYLSDIFLPESDSLLLPGVYHMDTTGLPMTWLPGRTYDGNVSGCYVLKITDSSLEQITLLTSGTMSVNRQGDTTLLDLVLYTNDSVRYSAHYRGILPYD